MSNAQLLRDFFDACWNQDDVDAADRYIGESYCIEHDPGDPWHQRTLTRAEYKERLRVSRAPFPDQRFTILETFDNGDSIAVNWTWAGTHLADLPGLPATGKSITMTGATVYRLTDHKFTGHWQVVDRLGVYQQLR